MQNYMEVPSNILTGKDLDYLSDMFEWNYGALKKTQDFLGRTQDEEIKNMLQKGINVFDENLNEVLTILGGTTNE